MRRAVGLLALSCLLAACSPSRSTVGGWDAAALKTLADRATTVCRARATQTPPRPFTTDGCSLSPDGSWQACCVEHDIDYWCGGSADDRRRAHATLRTCIA